MKPICFIGARGGSKGVINKNVRKIGGKPLIAHTIEACINSDIFQSVIVSTEDRKIAIISKKYGAEVPFIRPKRLSTDNASMDDVLLYGINKLYSLGYKFDILVNRDCTVPFIRNIDIAGSVELLRGKKCDAVFSVYRQHHNPYFNMMELNSRGFLKFSKTMHKKVKNRQDAPIVYQLNGFHTIFTKRLLECKTIRKLKALPYEVPLETGWMIDTEFEFKIAEMIFQHKKLFSFQ